MTEQNPSPVAVAEKLAGVYGHVLDRPVVYTQGVAISGRLRLHAQTGGESPVSDIEKIVAPRLAEGPEMFGSSLNSAGTANFAGICWADELYWITRDQRYMDLLIETANRFIPASGAGPISPPLDPDIRVEDFFVAGTILGRAFALTGDERYVDVLVNFLLAADTQQSDGLWWHCKSSPFYWGRGNAFAAMGFAETLSYLPTGHPQVHRLVESHGRHLAALRNWQDDSGMWRQVTDRPDSYLEHSATSMIGYVLARGLRLGWLSKDWEDVVEAAWNGVTSRIGENCELEHVCVGTGPQPDLAAYLERPFSDGQDDRGGSMALWFAAEMARLKAA